MRDPELTRHAKAMRREKTEPETRLWLQLRARRFARVKFRNQKVIGRYIVVFAANDPRLVIELDGDTHAFQAEYDNARMRFLENEGYRVLRYTNAEVMQNLEGVVSHLSGVIDELRRPPLPTLSPEGERANDGATDSLSPSGERVGERGTPEGHDHRRDTTLSCDYGNTAHNSKPVISRAARPNTPDIRPDR